MHGDKHVIQHLNKILSNELVAINQYYLRARMYKNGGLDKLGAREMHESIDEMKHADRLIDRMLLLDGLPNLQDLGNIMISDDVKDILTCDLKLELIAHLDLKAAITVCDAAKDFVSRDLLKEILEPEEEQLDCLETQLRLMERVGIQNYQQSQMEPKSAS